MENGGIIEEMRGVSREAVVQAIWGGEETKRGEREGRGRGEREACMVEGEVTHSRPSSLTLVAPSIHSLSPGDTGSILQARRQA